jgi:hypothetical protein
MLPWLADRDHLGFPPAARRAESNRAEALESHDPIGYLKRAQGTRMIEPNG